MKFKTTRSVFLIILICLFFSLPDWGRAAMNVSRSPNLKSTAPRIAIDPTGNLHVIWAEYYTDSTGDVFYAKYDLNTKKWSSPLNLSNSSLVYSPEYRPAGIDCDVSGNAYVAYIENTADKTSKVKLRIFSDGKWGSAIEISAHNDNRCDNARVVVDSSGNIFMIWWKLWPGTVYSRARIGGAWESVKQLNTPCRAKFPDIAVGNGMAAAVWYDKSGEIYQVMYAQRGKNFDSPWSTPMQIAPGSTPQEMPAVEIDGNDITHVVWTPVLNKTGTRIVQYAHWTGSGFSVPLDISTTRVLHYPSLHERGGNLYACWQKGPWGNGGAILYNFRRGETWAAEAAVPNSSGTTFSDLATSPDQDQVYFVWDGSGEIYCDFVVFKDDLLGTWDDQGVCFRDSASGTWTKLAPPADLIATGDLDGDVIDDIFGVWPNQEGVWVRYSKTGEWVRLAPTARFVSSGDMNGDGRKDLLGTWDGLGVFYRNSVSGAWVKLAAPADMVIAGDADLDGIDDLIGSWPVQGGIWGKSSKLGIWYKIAPPPRDMAGGDMNGDGRKDLLGTWDGQGVFYLDGASGQWVHLSAEAEKVAAGDLDGDATDDLLAVYTSSPGVWVKYSKTKTWSKLAGPARDITTGKMKSSF